MTSLTITTRTANCEITGFYLEPDQQPTVDTNAVQEFSIRTLSTLDDILMVGNKTSGLLEKADSATGLKLTISATPATQCTENGIDTTIFGSIIVEVQDTNYPLKVVSLKPLINTLEVQCLGTILRPKFDELSGSLTFCSQDLKPGAVFSFAFTRPKLEASSM